MFGCSRFRLRDLGPVVQSSISANPGLKFNMLFGLCISISKILFSSHSIEYLLKGIVDGNHRVKIYIHLLDLTRNRSEKWNFRSLSGIEPAALRFRCSALNNWAVWATETSCRALTTSSCIYTFVRISEQKYSFWIGSDW